MLLSGTWNILDQNTDFIVVFKSANMLSVPARLGKSDPRPVLGILIEQSLGQKIFPVHRLDYEVSGLMIFARNAGFHKTLNKLFEEQKIHKTYKALTKFEPNPAIKTQHELIRPEHWTRGSKGLWESKLVRGKKRTFEADHGDLAITDFEMDEVVGSDQTTPIYSWNLYPKTGRAHQLRYELASRGHPILGDQLYGSASPHSAPGIALSAIALEIPSLNLQWSLTN